MAKTLQNISLGKWGENYAAKRIQESGGCILSRNIRYARVEVDIVFTFNQTLVVCEVKTRTTNKFGHPLEIITLGKLNRLRSALNEALVKHNFRYGRIDAFGIVLRPKIEVSHVQGIEI